MDSSASDCRVMSSLLVQAGYDPVVSEGFTSAQTKIQKLPPGAVVLTTLNLLGVTARALTDWLKSENYSFLVIAIVENLNNADVLGIMRDSGAVDIASAMQSVTARFV